MPVHACSLTPRLETGVGQVSVVFHPGCGRELNRYNCFSALCSSRPGEPREFDEAAEKWSDEGTGFISPFSRTQHELGQFLTPRHVADFMATLFSVASPEVQLLDARARNLPF
jgi:hypothetical protein